MCRATYRSKVCRRSRNVLKHLIWRMSPICQFNASTITLVLGDIDLVSRGAIPISQHSVPNSLCPVGWGSEDTNSLTVNSLMLLVSTSLLLTRQLLCNSFKKLRALTAVLSFLIATNTQRVARSINTNILVLLVSSSVWQVFDIHVQEPRYVALKRLARLLGWRV